MGPETMQEQSPTPKLQTRFVVVLGLILVAAGARFVPYFLSDDSALKPLLWNFSPVFAIALFGGARFANRWVAFLVPLIVMIISDVSLHLLMPTAAFNEDWNIRRWELLQQGATYAVLVLTAVLGIGVQFCEARLARGQTRNWTVKVRGFLVSTGLIGAGSVSSSVLFFLISNFVVWLTASETMPPANQYPKTLAGLLECYLLALPFFGGTFLGNLYYTGLLFGGFGIAQVLMPGLKVASPERYRTASTVGAT